MSEPKNVFQQTRQHIKTGNLSFLTKQVAEWQKLTKLIQPLLPSQDDWQVVCYQHGILMITGENQALISQVGYLQKQYISQLSQINEFKDLHKIQVRLRGKAREQTQRCKVEKQIPPASLEMLHNAAGLVNDPKLSQALILLASNKK